MRVADLQSAPSGRVSSRSPDRCEGVRMTWPVLRLEPHSSSATLASPRRSYASHRIGLTGDSDFAELDATQVDCGNRSVRDWSGEGSYLQLQPAKLYTFRAPSRPLPDDAALSEPDRTLRRGARRSRLRRRRERPRALRLANRAPATADRGSRGGRMERATAPLPAWPQGGGRTSPGVNPGSVSHIDRRNGALESRPIDMPCCAAGPSARVQRSASQSAPVTRLENDHRLPPVSEAFRVSLRR
jgi:hypothetical protein